ncbi:hypothetical protein ACIQLJ_00555 [Microbacterium sp. NPDC091313]
MSPVDAGTRARIERLVDAADYRDSESALADASRIAFLAAVPGAERDRERVRRAAVDRANARRGGASRPVREAGTGHRVLLIVAIVLAALAVGLVAVSPRTGGPALELQVGMPFAGVIALVAVGILWWLEPLRASGALWGAHAPARIHLFVGLLLLLFAVSVPAFRWSEVDDFDPWPVILGLAGFALAGVGAIVLWVRARRGGGTPPGVPALDGGLIDAADRPAVLSALDEWWADQASVADARHDDIVAARALVLEYLVRTRLAEERRARAVGADGTIGPWKERRP